MANNRLYLYDPETGEKILLAKGWGDWCLYPTRKALAEWLKDRDIGAATSGSATTSLRLVTENDPEGK